MTVYVVARRGALRGVTSTSQLMAGISVSVLLILLLTP